MQYNYSTLDMIAPGVMLQLLQVDSVYFSPVVQFHYINYFEFCKCIWNVFTLEIVLFLKNFIITFGFEC